MAELAHPCAGTEPRTGSRTPTLQIHTGDENASDRDRPAGDGEASGLFAPMNGAAGTTPVAPRGRGVGGEDASSPLAPRGRGVGGEDASSPLAPRGRGVGGEGVCASPPDPADIVLDPEFQNLLPRSAPEEEKALQEALFRDGCREPLVVWPCQGRRVLLVGYEQFPTLRLYRMPFAVIEKPFACRDDARLFIIKDQLARKNLTPLAVSYLRGLRYQAEKQPHGGDRRSAAGGTPWLRKKTAEALAEVFHVDAATIRRDGEFAAAVNAIAAACGEDVKPWILSRGAKLTRGRVLKLAGLPAEEQQAAVAYLKKTGHLPRSWANRGETATITLPAEPEELAKELVRRCGVEYARRVAAALAAVLGQGAST